MLVTRVRYALLGLAFVLALCGGTASADELTCGGKYTIQDGDTLSDIAARAYKQPNKWTLIYYANQKQFGNEPILVTGNEVHVPCLVAPETSNIQIEPAGVGGVAEDSKIEVSRRDADLNILTADDYKPFTDRALSRGGMITDIVAKAFEALNEAGGGLNYRISWVNDWSAHLNPLLADKVFDMGFPWLKPDCKNYDALDKPAQFRCDTFFFSKPVFEILVVFFTLKDSSFDFKTDEDVVGRRICRPVGYFTFDLDKDGRNWVKEGKITLVRPQSVDECFRLLTDGQVDAVALNEFTGRAALKSNNLTDKVRVIENPISLAGLHVIIAKTHPRSRTFLHYINSALERLRENGDYEKIVDEHLSEFWGKEGSG